MSKTWFHYDYDDGFVTHASEQEAIDAAQDSLQRIRDIAIGDEEWPLDVEAICYGKIAGSAVSYPVEGLTHERAGVDFKIETTGDQQK